jgi:hypothetical protein
MILKIITLLLSKRHPGHINIVSCLVDSLNEMQAINLLRGNSKRDWRELHKEELHNVYFSPSIMRMIKSMRMKWAVHVAFMGR